MSLTLANIESVAARIEAAASGIAFHPRERFPEAMYEACREGKALCVADDEAVIVLRCDQDEDGQVLFIWWASTEKRGAGVPERCLPELLECAKSMNCRRLRFCSILEMWLKRAPELGWALRNMTFEMEVPP